MPGIYLDERDELLAYTAARNVGGPRQRNATRGVWKLIGVAVDPPMFHYSFVCWFTRPPELLGVSRGGMLLVRRGNP